MDENINAVVEDKFYNVLMNEMALENEILPYESDLTAYLLEQLSVIEESVKTQADKIESVLHKIDYQRLKYLLSRYLSVRIRKIERNILPLVASNSFDLLSAEETTYTQNFYKLIKKHIDDKMSGLPQSISEINAEKIAELDGANNDCFVFARVLNTLPSISITELSQDKENISTQTIDVDLIEGSCHFIRLSNIINYLTERNDGDLSLI